MSKRLALLIGNSLFEDPDSFSSLRTPDDDVHGFAEVLKTYGAFEIVDKLINESADTIKFAIEDFYAGAKRADLTLLYYSGHGHRDRAGRLYLIARNTQKNRLLSTGIGERFIRDAVNNSRSRHRVIILDSCFSGTFSLGQKSGETLVFEGLTGEAEAILASSGSVQFSFEEEGRHSLFTHHMLLGIETGHADIDNDGEITVEELFDYTERRVKKDRPQQTPMMHLNLRDSTLVIAKNLASRANTLFIGSAGDNNNFFRAWLSAKLRLYGYETCTEFSAEQDEGDVWYEVERNIAGKASAFICVLSEDSVSRGDTLRELSIAREVTSRKSFITPLVIERFERAKLPEGIEPENCIDFTRNWADGLGELLEELRKGEVSRPLESGAEDLLEHWTERLDLQTAPIHRSERYRSNWFALELPEHLFLHVPDTSISQTIVQGCPFPVFRDGSYIFSFACPDCIEDYIPILESDTIPIKDFLADGQYETGRNYVVKHTNRKIIQLLNAALESFFKQRGLKQYVLSNETAFYVPALRKPLKVKIDRYGRRDIQLTGKRKGNTWHFGVSGRAFLYPTPAYFLRYHIVFTKNKQHLNKRAQHRHRRGLSRSWYNKRWRDLVLGMMLWLTNQNDEQLLLPVGCSRRVVVNNYPIEFQSPVGYVEP